MNETGIAALLLWFVSGLIGAAFAEKKKKAGAGLLLGLLLGPVGWALAYLVVEDGRPRCPECGTPRPGEWPRCAACGELLPTVEQAEEKKNAALEEYRRKRAAAQAGSIRA